METAKVAGRYGCKLLYEAHLIDNIGLLMFQEIEAVLHAVSSIADNVESDERVCLPVLFRGLSMLPLQHEKVVSCALALIGETSFGLRPFLILYSV